MQCQAFVRGLANYRKLYEFQKYNEKIFQAKINNSILRFVLIRHRLTIGIQLKIILVLRFYEKYM